MSKSVSRRQFLRRSGGTLAGAAVVSTGATMVAPRTSWAAELSALSADQGATLMQFVQTLFPHPGLAEKYYAVVVKDLDAGAAADEAAAKVLKEGIASLESAGWSGLSRGKKTALADGMAGTPFFDAVRGKVVTSLYNQKEVWAHFGYEGSSFEQGGYIKRGFDDLDWLSNPPADASPKAHS